MQKMELILDSGAFTSYKQGVIIDIDTYIEFVKKYEKYLYAYINLDVMDDKDGSESYANWLYIKSKGLNPLPVYHPHADIKYLELYMEKEKYICIGGIASLNTEVQIKFFDRLWPDYLVDKEGYPKLKVHGLGLTALSVLLRYPWWSVDSTTWLVAGRFGSIYVPKKINGRYDYSVLPWLISVSTRSPSQQEETFHINTLAPIEQKLIMQYISEQGYVLGKSEFKEVDLNYSLVGDERWMNDFSVVEGISSKIHTLENVRIVEKIIERGLGNDHIVRDSFNFLYFQALEKSLPTWPWAYKPKKKIQTLGLI